MSELQFKYGTRPAVRFRHAVRQKRNRGNMLGKVCIIGAFPTVSKKLMVFNDLATARKKLEITADVHDLEKIWSDADEEYVANPNYFYGAGALRFAFMGDTEELGASEVLVCNISTQELDSNGDPKCVDNVPQFNTSLNHDPRSEYYVTPTSSNIEQQYPKLDVALSKLKSQKFDSLIFAYPIEEAASGTTDEDGLDTGIKTVLLKLRDFAHDSYSVQNPLGIYLGLNIPPTATEETNNTANNSSSGNSGGNSGGNTGGNSGGSGDTPTVGNSITPTDNSGQSTTANTTISNVVLTNDTTLSIVDSVVETNKSKKIDKDLAIKYLDLFKDPTHYCHTIYAFVLSGIDTDLRKYSLGQVETAAFLAGYTAGQPADTILTQKTIPHITGVTEELNYDPTFKDPEGNQNDGILLLGHGATLFECKDRTTNEWCIVNSKQPCGYDIAHLRTAAYIIKQITAAPFLGKINRETTVESIDAVIASMKETMISQFPIVESISHSVEKVSATCVQIWVHINFFGIIIDEFVYVTMSVEGNPEGL